MLIQAQRMEKIHYWTLKSELETHELANKYGGYSTWQGEMILENIWTIKSDMNLYENGLEEFVTNTSYSKEQIQKEYEKIMNRIEAGDWKSFVEEELKDQENQIKLIKEQIKNTTDDVSKKQLTRSLEILKLEEQVNRWRLEKEIPNLESASVSSSIENLIPNMGLVFILAISVMITGTIVSEEFNKGTIKLLLIRPYTRRKIMLSKIIASVIAVLISMVALVIVQIIVSGICFGFNTIDIPVVKYNFNTNTIIEMNVFK